ncbi:hypothetical protein [Nocardiopsis metallicus]|uniref:Uncharacterized protein n=1 Tax=Nocardiopsis metallicus TaxID=179819 RepID=A0A840W2G5_9ACTN|nr:hypothetical protein [Nocardiopsis metallicus]MBB5489473.1 hypothetical protein [Nocardiopsis metallicus]
MNTEDDQSPPHTRQERADTKFDTLSEILREARSPEIDPRRSLIAADEAFSRLHAWISRGGLLPQPWHRHDCPGSSDN